MSEHTKGDNISTAIIKRQAAELAAARALLREAMYFGVSDPTEFNMVGDGAELITRIRSYLDACDTLGEGNG